MQAFYVNGCVLAVSLSLLPPFSVADGQEIAHLWRFLHVMRPNPCVECPPSSWVNKTNGRN